MGTSLHFKWPGHIMEHFTLAMTVLLTKAYSIIYSLKKVDIIYWRRYNLG